MSVKQTMMLKLTDPT